MKNALLISILLGFVLLFAGCTAQKAELSGASGAVGAAACADSDGGVNAGVRGTVTLGAQRMTDTCNGNRLVEYFCKNANEVSSNNANCAAGKVCQNGACVAAPVPAEQCRVVNGIVQYTNNGQVTNYANGCDAQGRVVSYSCLANGSVSTQVAPCGAGTFCNAGACFAPVCTDSDNGLNIGVAGTTSTSWAGQVNGSFNDICTQNGTGVVENFCQGATARSLRIGCGGWGQICQNGACIDQ